MPATSTHISHDCESLLMGEDQTLLMEKAFLEVFFNNLPFSAANFHPTRGNLEYREAISWQRSYGGIVRGHLFARAFEHPFFGELLFTLPSWCLSI
eukprot:3554523-Amphidinium_carterae.1